MVSFIYVKIISKISKSHDKEYLIIAINNDIEYLIHENERSIK